VVNSVVTPAELTFLKELRRLKVKFMVVGMGAAAIQGADRGTEDLDLWFQSLSDPNIDVAARAAGGVFSWRALPPMVAGRDLDHIDIVYKCDGLGSFEEEYAKATTAKIFDVAVKALPLERVLASKLAANRPKDKAAVPALEAAIAAKKSVP
jgi:hypothetical protein